MTFKIKYIKLKVPYQIGAFLYIKLLNEVNNQMKSIYNKRQKSSGVKEFAELQNIENLLKGVDSLYQSNNIEIQPQETIIHRNIKLPIKHIEMTEHAYKRASQRLNLSDRNQALNYIKGWFKNSQYISDIYDDDSESYGCLYGHRGIAIVTSPDLKKVLTVYKKEFVTYEPLKKQVYELHRKKLNNYVRQENAKLKKLELLELECEVEVASLRLRSKKTRSQVVRNVCEARVNAIKQSLEEYKQELKQLQSERVKVAKSMISVI